MENQSNANKKNCFYSKNESGFYFIDDSSGAFRAAEILNIFLLVFASGQTVTVGNGMSEIDAFIPLTLNFIGLACHFNQVDLIDSPQSISDRPTVKSQKHRSLQ